MLYILRLSRLKKVSVTLSGKKMQQESMTLFFFLIVGQSDIFFISIKPTTVTDKKNQAFKSKVGNFF